MPTPTSPWTFQGLLILTILAAITWFRPMFSLRLFVLCAPIGNISQLFGWDLRIYWALILAAKAWWQRRRPRSFGFDPFPSRVLQAGAVFFVFSFIALRFQAGSLGPEDKDAAQSLWMYALAASVTFPVFFYLVDTKEKLQSLIPCISLGALGVSAYGIIEAWQTYRDGPADRIASTLGNSNYLAAYLSVAATALLVLSRGQTGKIRCLSFAAVGLACFCCALTLSRTGIVACVAGAALAWITREGKVNLRKTVGVLLLLLVVAAFAVGTYFQDLRHQVTFSDDPNTADVAQVGQQAEDFSRLEAATFALQSIGEHPWMGLGFGTFAAANYQANGMYVVTHNTLLEILAGSGLIGFTLIGCAVLSGLVYMGRRGRMIVLPVAGCFAVNSMLGDYLQSIDVMVVLALIYLFSLRRGDEQTATITLREA